MKDGHTDNEYTRWHEHHADKIDFTYSCWIWKGAHGGKGYGRVKYDKKPEFAHRAAYIEAYGGIEPHALVRHLCHNRKCVRPSHLAQGTIKQNAMDSAVDFNFSGDLNKSDVRAIRFLYDKGVPLNAIAVEFGIAYGTVYPIVCYKSYAHVDPQFNGDHSRRTTGFISDDTIREARQMILAGEPNAQIARNLGINGSAVSNIRTGKRYSGRGV